MFQDALGSLLAVQVFACVLYAPGYAVAYFANIFGFRQMTLAAGSMWAIACSLCTMPILAYLTGRVAGIQGICWMVSGFTLVTICLFIKNTKDKVWLGSSWATAAIVAVSWTAFVLAILIDVQVGHKLYFSVVMADQSYRIAFTDAVVRTGVPPLNPLYFGGHAAPMRYYYFWYVLCAVVVKLAHISARQAFIASSVWAGLCLLTTVHLYGKYFFVWTQKQRWLAAALLLVSGADLLPAAGNALLQSAWNGDIEWWSVDPIDAWPDSLLWVPHHVVAVLCCLLCFLLVWRTREALTRRDRWWAVVLAGTAFASAFGLSVYVAIAFVFMATAWLVRCAVVRKPDSAAILRLSTVVAVLSAVLLLPFSLELLTGSRSSGAGGPIKSPFSLSVRPIIDSGLVTALPVFSGINRSHPVLLDHAVRLVLLLPGLAMELGILGAVLLLLLADKRRSRLPDEARDTAIYLSLCGLTLAMFVSSAVISNNDFGYRSVMLPQFFLLLLTADVLGSWWFRKDAPVLAVTSFRQFLLYGLLILGVGGTIYGSLLLRLWLPLQAHSTQSGFNQLPEDAYEVREAFSRLDTLASTQAVIAISPADPTRGRKDEVLMPNEFYQRMLVMDAGRQMLNGDWKCAIEFGGDPAACPAIREASAQLYASPAPDAAWASRFCERFGVQYLALGHRDVDWAYRTGWMTSLPVVARQPGFELFQCGPTNHR